MRLARLLAALPLAIGLLLTAIPAVAQTQADLPAALDWLARQQAADGGFSNGFASGSDLSATADAVLAIVSAGMDPRAWVKGDGSDPLDFMAAFVAQGGLSGPGQAAKVSLAVSAAGLQPADFGGVDLTGEIRAGYDPGLGLFGTGPFDSALAILALSRAGQPLPPGAVEGLLATRLEDGSYSFDGDPSAATGDSNTTAIVLQALSAAGRPDAMGASLEYLRGVQNPDGGWTYQVPSEFGTETDANSTALVIQALYAAGEDPQAWGDPGRALGALQNPSGALAFNASTPGDNILATLQAIPAFAGTPLNTLRAPVGGAQASPAAGALALQVVILLFAILLIAAAAGWIEARR